MKLIENRCFQVIPDMRVVLLVDMDAFFASVEQQSNPALRGKPIGVIGAGHRTVITTSSYEARKYGVNNRDECL